MNQRRGLATAVAGSNSNIIHSVGSSSSSSVTSISQLFLSMEAAGIGAGMYRSLPHPPQYSSLPSFAVPAPLGQPPLLPLPPFSKSATLPTPSGGALITGRVKQNHKKNRAQGAGSRKVCRPTVNKLPTIAAVDGQEVSRAGEYEDQLVGMSLYSISPPPSSLPLPRFMLRKPGKAAALPCNVEVAGGSGRGDGGGVVEPSSSDDLRRLLRL